MRGFFFVKAERLTVIYYTMSKLSFIVLSALLMVSCVHKQKFNSEIWKQEGVDWQITDVREKMVDDLLSSDTLIGLRKEEVVALLGESAHSDTSGNSCKYLIREKYEWNIDPEYTSYLIIQFDSNDQVYNVSIQK